MPFKSEKQRKWMWANDPEMAKKWEKKEKKMKRVKELIKKMVREELDEAKAKRDYKAEYKKFQSSTKSKKYRAELNAYNRKKGLDDEASDFLDNYKKNIVDFTKKYKKNFRKLM